MISLLIEDTERMLNGLELMEEFKVQPSYTDIQLLNQLIGRAKHMVEHQLEINKIKNKEVSHEIAD